MTAARKLLDKLPPHKATISSIARSAGVDPALVRYYFSSREELLLAVIEDILANWQFSHPPVAAGPLAKLASDVRDMVDFALNVRSMQRLMIDECASSDSAEIRRRVRELNTGVVSRYALMLHAEKSSTSATDPLFMHVAIIGMCEFFAAAQAMIMPLVPDGIDAAELATRTRFRRAPGARWHALTVEPWSVKAPAVPEFVYSPPLARGLRSRPPECRAAPKTGGHVFTCDRIVHVAYCPVEFGAARPARAAATALRPSRSSAR